MHKVSVIVPIYNAAKYLRQCLNSIITQTLKDIEIILIDDGSNDASAEICQEYLKDSRFSYYHKNNEGLAAARADGILRAAGEYIGFVDSDDWIEPNMFETMYSVAQTNSSDIVFCNCIENEKGHRFTPEMPSGPYNRKQIEEIILPRTLAYIGKYGEKRAIRWCNWLRIYKRTFLEEHHIQFDRRLRRSQDLQFTYMATLYAQNYYYLGDDYLYHNRVVPDSLSRGYTKNMWLLYVMLIEDLYQLTENFKELNLLDQMHLRNFFFVTDCIENEMKLLCPNDMQTRIHIIREIMDHPLCKRFQGHIPVEKLNSLYQKYYELIHEKNAEEIFRFTEKYKKKQAFQNNVIRPLMNFFTESKIIGSCYKFLRWKQR